jgi:hypothetical protein
MATTPMIECMKCYERAEFSLVNHDEEALRLRCKPHALELVKASGPGWLAKELTDEDRYEWAQILAAQAINSGKPTMVEHEMIYGPRMPCQIRNCGEATHQVWADDLEALRLCQQHAVEMANHITINGRGPLHWAHYQRYGQSPGARFAKRAGLLAAGALLGGVFGG